MMSAANSNRNDGFTLVELMVVVAIIGILASVAIPSFLNYQLNAKRAEAFANLGSLGKAQKSYFAEFNEFIWVVAEPSGGGVGPGALKRDHSRIDAAFSDVGWVPDSDVYFDYDTATADNSLGGTCTCTEGCFTAAAYGDLDGDNAISVLLYTHPDAVGDFCETGQGNNQSPPIINGSRAFDQVARVAASATADDF